MFLMCFNVKKIVYNNNSNNYNKNIVLMIIVYYKISHEAKTAYGQNTIKSLKPYNIITLLNT